MNHPETRWHWQSIQATKNSCLTHGNKVVTNEFVITKLVPGPLSHRGSSATPTP